VIDFNGDGFGDGVFTTSNPDQLVVVFGNGSHSLLDSNGNPNSALASDTIRLNAPGPITSFVVGDFNGDGKPDIAISSAGPNNAGGVEVFLNQIGNSLLDPVGAANYTKNPLGAHPFSTPLFSAIPTLTDYGIFAGTGGILALTAGDFNGDGVMDLGYVEQVTPIISSNPVQEVVGELFGSPVLNPTTGHVVTNPVTGRPEGTGFFYANQAPEAAAPLLQISLLDTNAVPILKATSLTSTNVPIGSTTGIPTHPEVLLYGSQGGGAVEELTPGIQSGFGLNVSMIPLGSVDTTRTLMDVSATAVTLQDFTVADLNGDGNADIIALTQTPVGYIVTLGGDGGGGFTIESGTGDNAGIFLGGTAATPPPTTTIVPLDANSDGNFGQAAVLQFGMNGPEIVEFSLVMGPVAANGTTAFATALNANPLATLGTGTADMDQAVQGLDTFYEHVESSANPHPVTGFGLLSPNSTIVGDSYLNIFASVNEGLTEELYFTNNGFKIYSGDGGNAIIGAGGNAGALGSATPVTAGTASSDAISIVLPMFAGYEGSVFLSGGHGGNGFTTGGIGGDIQGVSVAYATGTSLLTSNVQLLAGNGGDGISGAGGRGGILGEFTVSTGTFFGAGTGGTGLSGGAGGSVLGNTNGISDTSTSNVLVISGAGGIGATAGGTGGDITSFDAVFLPLVGGVGGSLTYITGPGGNTAGGVGGAGGSIVNSSPDPNINNLAGDITLETGAGGSGLSGGAGGAITNFVNSPTGSSIPARLNVLTGNGGIGISGTGGAGGSITNVQVSATGLANNSFGALSGLVRVLAGNGGSSYATTGGAGGSITDSTLASTSTPIVVAAGAGGDAPLVGGAGGSVTDSVISSAAQAFGKMLVIAGDGGDATAVTRTSVSIGGDANTNDLAHALLAFGGSDGIGGNGGNITNITQPSGSETAVDLIAGNGGSTINSGGPLEAVTGVGQGGSVVGINLAGTAGSITRDTSTGITYPPIKSYTDLNATGTDDVSIATFLATYIGGTVSTNQTTDFVHAFIPNDPSFMLDDAAGNVGIVAGRAGFVKGNRAASDGISGSVEDITASSIMSIVAGSVNNVAPVQVLSGITLSNPDGILGADKSVPTSTTSGAPPNGQLDYYSPGVGDVQDLQPGDRLIDGALFAITINQPAGAPFIVGPRVFSVNDNGI
jgi:hypothetical protein